MRYYLELAPLHRDPIYRLQADRTWRKVDHLEPLRESDYTTPHASDIIHLRQPDQLVTLEGKEHHISPPHTNGFDALKAFYFTAYVSRDGETPRPSFDQMLEAISKGDDRYSNRLILNVNGTFEVRRCDLDEDTFRDPSVVVRHESFQAGGGYVGPKAGADSVYFKPWFTDSLDAWRHHLKTGQCNVYSDIHTDSKLEDIEKEIASIG